MAPDIVQAIYEGRQPCELRVKALSANLPIEWADQRRALVPSWSRSQRQCTSTLMARPTGEAECDWPRE